ncbi:MAG: hypothetical protein WC229_02310 [Candidatus Paceibacterota bacterium]|jgi:hypothetical protein
MKTNSKKWRVISGIAGLTFFIIANFTNIFAGLNVLAGCLQIVVNVFVFTCWAKAYPRCRGFERFVTFIGVIVPPIMAGITIWRVLLPAVLN